MGYLPIIVALLAFIFLWGIVNYNSLKNKRELLNQKSEEIFKYAALRNATLRQLAKVASQNNASLVNLFTKATGNLNDSTIKDMSATEKVKVEHNTTLVFTSLPPAVDDDESYETLYKQLEISDDFYRKAVSSFIYRLNDYNQMVTTLPTKWVAGLMHFKPVDAPNWVEVLK